MQYPLISEYVAAIRDAEDNLDTLKHLKPVTDKYGEPYRSSGAFAVVFKMTDERTGKCYALKCFTEEQDGRAEAYRQISEELEYCNSHYITSVKYIEEELYVDSNCEENEFPVLLMDWIDGETMEAYIAVNYADKYAMSMLCYHFCQMAAWLRSQPFAHGDIKPDNIMVRPDGTLTLVDYDGMFVPSMKGRKSPTIGTKDFSHPLRTIDDFDDNIDDFALSTIALSLKAISLSSSLFTEYGASDRLLFSATDYLDLSKSKAFAALNELLADEDLRTLMSMFLLASAKKDLSLCSFRLFRVSGINDAATILKYGKNYCKGWNGFEKNKHKAFVLYKKIAELGNSDGQWRLGYCYELGQGVAKDYGKAVEWYRKSAEQGSSVGQRRLGACYEFGQGVDKDYGKAAEWYRKSAEQGDSDGQWNLGVCYEFGRGVGKNYGEAVEWYRKSAEQGNSNGQWRLGYCYELGHNFRNQISLVLLLEQGFYIKLGTKENGNIAVFFYATQEDANQSINPLTSCNFTKESRVLLEKKQYTELLLCDVLADNGTWVPIICKNEDTNDYDKAVEWYRKSAEQGNSDGQWRLGNCYAFGRGVDKDYGKAAEWYRKSAEQGNSKAQWRLGVCYYNGLGVDKDYGKAAEWYRKSAEQGDSKAQWRLGVCYAFGRGVDEDYGKAVEWFKKAAEQGDSGGQWRLGYFYEFGKGVDKDYGKAVEWYTKSAEQGDSDGQWRLGYCYEFGQGVDKDYGKAVEWYRKSAEQGNSVGQWRLGYCYEFGRGVDKDYGKAAEWYTKSAEQGNSVGQWRLGYCYYNGQGVDEDYGKAAEWYRKSAEQGNSVGQWRLGYCYEFGQGIDRDYGKAAEWYTKSAEQGDSVGQRRLGYCYELDRGVDKDYGKALEWYRKAAEQGNTEAKKKLELLGENTDL